MASRLQFVIGLVAGMILVSGIAWGQQDLGHKFPGGIGIDAGVQNKPGFYVGDRISWFASTRIKGREGKILPVKGLSIDAVGNALGVDLTLKLPFATYYGVSAAAPLAHVAVSSDQPEASVSRFGLGDFYFMPAHLGWQLGMFDVVTSYGFYVPSGRFEAAGGKGVSSGQWTHQFSAGGAVFFDREKHWRASALASYDLNQKKQGIDAALGSTLTIQGGAGIQLYKVLDVGVAGYALWQVTDNRGADVPNILLDTRERVFGLGPEVAVLIPWIRTQVGARYEWDLGARVRPEGRVLSVSATFLAWKPGE